MRMPSYNNYKWLCQHWVCRLQGDAVAALNSATEVQAVLGSVAYKPAKSANDVRPVLTLVRSVTKRAPNPIKIGRRCAQLKRLLFALLASLNPAWLLAFPLFFASLTGGDKTITSPHFLPQSF